MTALHSGLTGSDVHVPIAFTYANAAARVAAVVVTADLYKFARQSDDNSVWMLTATTPTWVRIDPAGVASSSNAVDVVAIKNTAGTISKGEVCYIAGWDSGNNAVKVEKARADSSTTMTAIGVATGAFTEAATGYLRVVGEITGLDTSAWSVNDLLHVSPTTAGALINTHVSGPNIHQQIGRVLKSDATTGVISCNVPPGFDHISNSTPANDSTTPTSGTSAFASRSDHAHRQAAYAHARASTDQSTSSGTFADVSGASVTVTTQANSKLLIVAQLSGVTGGNSGKIIVLVDGVQQGTGSNIHGHTGNGGAAVIVELTAALTAAAHTIKVQWARISGTLTMNASSAPTTDGCQLWALEVFP
jgi:hypothetical protein